MQLFNKWEHHLEENHLKLWFFLMFYGKCVKKAHHIQKWRESSDSHFMIKGAVCEMYYSIHKVKGSMVSTVLLLVQTPTGAFLCGVCMLSVWLLSGFLPQPCRLIGDSKYKIITWKWINCIFVSFESAFYIYRYCGSSFTESSMLIHHVSTVAQNAGCGLGLFHLP